MLGEKFRALFPDEQTLGVMLPNANGTCATVLGVMSAGKVPAMINFTAGATNILSACKAAEGADGADLARLRRRRPSSARWSTRSARR